MDRDYLWPKTLRMPVRPPKVVYLDLNHWINLAKIEAGRLDSKQDKELFHFCRKSVENKSAIFPISLSIFTEILKIKNFRRRQCLRRTIEYLSQYWVVTNRFIVATHEMESLLDQMIGPNPTPISSTDYLTWGIWGAMGRSFNLRIVSDCGSDVTSINRQSFPEGPYEFDRVLAKAKLEFNRQILEGPSKADESEFRLQGYNPKAILELYEQEANTEESLARQLDQYPNWRRGRLRDVVSAREIASEIYDILKKGCAERRVEGTLESLFPTVDDTRNAFDSMPSFDATVTLKTSIHRNSMHRWRNNHIHDIIALSVALPYCDIVVTDREMASLASQSKLTERFNTKVLSTLSDLREHL